jgi:F0F1-type ATP synthase membrane subunit b/b'
LRDRDRPVDWPAIDFLGNISLRLVGLLCTLAVMAASYYFFVKPALETTTHAIDSVSEPIKQAQREAAQAQQQLEQQAQQKGKQGGAQGTQVQIQKLQKCVRHARQSVNRLQACANRYGP